MFVAMSAVDVRADPSDAFIDSIRERYPTEREIDRVLTEKMRRRGGPGFSGISLKTMEQGTAALVRHHIGDDFEISNGRWLQGGASKLQMAFELEWNGPAGGTRQVTTMVLRMGLPESIVETSRRREHLALQAMGGVVPVPACHWIDADGEYLPHPALIYEFNAGRTRPAARPSQQVTGIGINFGPQLRNPVARDFVDHLAAIHRADPTPLLHGEAFDPAEVGSNASVIRQVHWWLRVWEEDRGEAHPVIAVAAQWLIENAPPLDHVSIVHGDFRSGNFLFCESEERITAWLDWELSVLGDRHQDLTWTMSPYFGHFAEDGKTFLVSGLLTEDEFLHRYSAASGLIVDPQRLVYFRIFNTFVTCVHMFGTAYRVALQSKTHQDIVVAWLAMIGPIALANLTDLLEQHI
ncbi:MAG: aminoglycoside phosphotransferase (APT) family kinase protein [Gammaproteobacteria bacterium]